LPEISLRIPDQPPPLFNDPSTPEQLKYLYGEQDDEFQEDRELQQESKRSFIGDPPKPRSRKVFSREGVEVAFGTGSRKESAAVVSIRPGTGVVTVNHRSFVDYFPFHAHRGEVIEPFRVTETLGMFDLRCAARGGGISGQAGAIKMALARALQNWDPEHRPALKLGLLLRRDERMVERKKFGQPKARKKFQWAKR